MAEQEAIPNYNSDFTAEASLRINDLEERTNTLKEKINLISRNFISTREELDEKMEKMEKENSKIKKEISSLKKTLINLSQESEKWVRRDEIVLIERMLKDFQPLEFLRKKDFKEYNEKNKVLAKKESSEKNKNPRKLNKE